MAPSLTTLEHQGTTREDTVSQGIIDLGKSLTNLIFHGPLFASIFAIAFVIGYFYAFNITWYSFFTISEQLVFALEGLPVALGGSIVLLILVSISIHPEGWRLSPDHKELWLRRIGNGWIVILLIASAWFLFNKSFVGPVCFISLILGVYCFTHIHQIQEQFMHVTYWGINVGVLCLLVGYGNGEYHKKFPIILTLTLDKEGCGYNFAEKYCNFDGQVLFYGAAGLLFFDKNAKTVSLIKEKDIVKISEQVGKNPAPGAAPPYP